MRQFLRITLMTVSTISPMQVEVYRANFRTCGGTKAMCETSYHSGLTSDSLRIVQEIATRELGPIFVVGFSRAGTGATKPASAVRLFINLFNGRNCTGADVLRLLSAASAAFCDHGRTTWMLQLCYETRVRAETRVLPKQRGRDRLDRWARGPKGLPI
jgi:hypothetical protein